MPNVENKFLEEKRESFLKYIHSNTIVFSKNIETLSARLDKLFSKAITAFEELSKTVKHGTPSELFCDGSKILTQLHDFNLVEIKTYSKSLSKFKDSDASTVQSIKFDTKPQPSFNKQFDLLIDNLQKNTEKGFVNYLFCDTEKQAKRFHDIFTDVEEDVIYKTVVFPLYQGFIDVENKIVCYTDHQIFERYHKFKLKNGFAKKQSITLKELTSLEIGDYVTHIDHGIGKFGGLQKIDVEGKKQEAIKLIYGDCLLYTSDAADE